MGTLFGEDQGRYLIACNFDQAEALMAAAARDGVPIQTVGRFGGDAVHLGAASAPLEDLSRIFRSSFGNLFAEAATEPGQAGA